MSRRIGIVGAGLGGVAAALRLAHEGCEVTVFEKTAEVGGRAKTVRVGDVTMDAGPTLLMMREPFHRLFEEVGERLEDHLDITLCDPSYRVFWADGSQIDGTPNVARMVRQIEHLVGREEAERYGKLIGDLAELYRESVPNFVRRNYNSPLDLASPKAIHLVLKHHMLDNLAARVARYVEDPRLRMLFSFQTMYLGLSPYDAPWVYGVLTYMEYGEGIWHPRGGLGEIPRAVARLAETKGAHIRLETPVASIDGNRITLENGEEHVFDAIIANADLPYTEQKLAGRREKRRRHSCSALMFYMDYDGELPELLHHNVFFGADFKENLDRLFHEPLALHPDPAFYAAISAKTEPKNAPAERSNLYILVPAPNLDYSWTPEDVERTRQHVFGRLCGASSFDPARVLASKTYGPQDWKDDLNLDKGAAFGLSHDFWQSVCFRPSNRDRFNPHLFYAGASTTPGNGLPMVLISAELAVQRILGK
jgi:phytoene desaturase